MLSLVASLVDDQPNFWALAGAVFLLAHFLPIPFPFHAEFLDAGMLIYGRLVYQEIKGG